MQPTYCRLDAVRYARLWAFGRNPAYADFSAMGGDCTNFISQCLFAGCGVMNTRPDTGWFYRSLDDRAAAWTGVEYLHTFLTTNTGAGPYGAETPEDTAQPGDILQLSFDGAVFAHSLLVLGTAAGITVAAHDDDSCDRPAGTYNYRRARLIRIEGVRP